MNDFTTKRPMVDYDSIIAELRRLTGHEWRPWHVNKFIDNNPGMGSDLAEDGLNNPTVLKEFQEATVRRKRLLDRNRDRWIPAWRRYDEPGMYLPALPTWQERQAEAQWRKTVLAVEGAIKTLAAHELTDEEQQAYTAGIELYQRGDMDGAFQRLRPVVGSISDSELDLSFPPPFV